MRLYDEFLTWLMIAAFFATFALAKVSRADEPKCEVLLPKCTEALSACDQAVLRLQEQVVVKDDSIQAWKKQAKGSRDVPLLVWAGLAGAVGGGVGAQVAGGSLAGGAAVGAAVGLIIGLIGE